MQMQPNKSPLQAAARLRREVVGCQGSRLPEVVLGEY